MEENEKDGKREETAAENPPAPPAEDVSSPVSEEQKKIDELTAQYHQMREIAARAQADGINYRNWAEREFKRLKAYGSERAVLAMLPVFDNLELALGNAEANPASIRDGVRMVKKQFADALKVLGVSELDPTGKPFSPLEHDAMGMTPVAEKAKDGTVCVVVRKGFSMADKVIRPAMVMVGRYTEPKPEAGADEQKDGQKQDGK